MKNKKLYLRRKCDLVWFRKYLKDRCEVCGKGGVLQGHHFYYKGSYPSLRYSELNHITLCLGCHAVLHWKDPKKIEEQIIAKRGKTWYKKLKRLSKKKFRSKLNIAYYEGIIKKLAEQNKSKLF